MYNCLLLFFVIKADLLHILLAGTSLSTTSLKSFTNIRKRHSKFLIFNTYFFGSHDLYFIKKPAPKCGQLPSHLVGPLIINFFSHVLLLGLEKNKQFWILDLLFGLQWIIQFRGFPDLITSNEFSIIFVWTIYILDYSHHVLMKPAFSLHLVCI